MLQKHLLDHLSKLIEFNVENTIIPGKINSSEYLIVTEQLEEFGKDRYFAHIVFCKAAENRHKKPYGE